MQKRKRTAPWIIPFMAAVHILALPGASADENAYEVPQELNAADILSAELLSECTPMRRKVR